MYLRSTPRRNKDGSVVRYLQLAHNVWDPAAKRSRVQVVYNFGREDQANREALQRLVASVTRFLDPGQALAAAGEGLQFIESRPLGGTWVLDGLWHRLGIDKTMTRLLAGRRRDERAERVLFALVANRALAPSSKLAAARWVNEDVLVDGLTQTTDDACYRAMDWLIEIKDALEQEVFHQVANLLNLEVDLLFFDTTSTYFEVDQADTPVARNERGMPLPDSADDGGYPVRGFRSYGKSKDHRDDLPQVVIGMAVTRTGIPVRVWCWPGATNDSALIRQVKDDMRDWTLSRIVWVADRGFASEANRRWLRQGDHHYIIGEKLRSGSDEATAALSRQGRYQDVAANLRVKEVRIAKGERFVICFNPDAAERDAAIRTRLVAQLEELIDGSNRLSVTKRAELRGVISTKPGLNRYLRDTPVGCCASTPRPSRPKPTSTASTCCAPATPSCPPKTSPWATAAPRSRTRLARYEAGHRPTTDLPPQGATHPRPRRAVLARAAAGPPRRNHLRPPLAGPAPRTRPHRRRHLHRTGRRLPPTHRDHQAPARHPRQAAPRPAPTHPPAHARRRLTCTYPHA
jgi:hypothetical protein